MHGILFLFACEWDAFGLFVLSKGGKFGLRFSIGGVFEGGSGCAWRVIDSRSEGSSTVECVSVIGEDGLLGGAGGRTSAYGCRSLLPYLLQGLIRSESKCLLLPFKLNLILSQLILNSILS